MNDIERFNAIRANLSTQLDWRGPNGKAQGVLTLTRTEAEAVCLALATLSKSQPATSPTPEDIPNGNPKS